MSEWKNERRAFKQFYMFPNIWSAQKQTIVLLSINKKGNLFIYIYTWMGLGNERNCSHFPNALLNPRTL